MVRPIVKDTFFLQQKSEPATKADKQVIEDLLDTLKAHEEDCVGLAANMIGVKKNIIVVHLDSENRDLVMVNPEIVKKVEPFETEEGCLSLEGIRKCTRYAMVEVKYLDKKFKPQQKRFMGWTAEIIQHEIDHCNGILI